MALGAASGVASGGGRAHAGANDYPDFTRLLVAERWDAAVAWAEANDLYHVGDADDLAAVALALRLNGDAREAERHLRRALFLSGRNARLIFELAVAQYAQGDFVAAERNFRSLLGEELPAEARRELAFYLRDIRAQDNTRWSVSFNGGRERISAERNSNFVQITPSLFRQFDLPNDASAWLRPSVSVRLSEGGDYNRYSPSISSGLNLPLGKSLLRPSVSYTHSRQTRPIGVPRHTATSSARLGVRRTFGIFVAEPYASYTVSRGDKADISERFREYGTSLNVYPSRRVVLSFSAAFVRLNGVPGNRVSRPPFNQAQRTRQTARVEFRGERLSVSPSVTRSETRYKDNLCRRIPFLPFIGDIDGTLRDNGCPVRPIPHRKVKTLRAGLELTAHQLSFNGYEPSFELFFEQRKSNDPFFLDAYITRGIELGFSQRF